MNQQEVARILDEIGTMLEVLGENPFKCRAFHNAAGTIANLTTDLRTLVESGELKTIKGIGPALTENITELVTTGAMKYYEELRKQMPSGFSDLIRIQGLGPKKINLLHKELKIQTVADLKKAASEHKLAGIPGLGAKTEENILKAIEQREKTSDRHLFPQAKETAERILETVLSVNGVIRGEIAGSLRRKKEVIGDIDIVVAAPTKAVARIMETFTTHPDVAQITGKGDTKSSVILASGINCDLRVVSDSEFPFALAYFTGSKEHNVEMRSLARKAGLSLNEYGFSPVDVDGPAGKKKAAKGGKSTSCKTEEDIYRTLKLQYVPPELRENMGEVESAGTNSLPELIEYGDITGTFHCHSTYSDGTATLEQMAQGCIAKGWKYLGIADHSKIAAYAGGLDEAKLKRQQKEIDDLNGKLKGFRLFKGTEVDILPDGTLDYTDKVLERFDFVVASIHSKFKMTAEEATKRLIKALKNRHVSMLGHPTGRLLLERDGYPVNMIDIINAAADYGKMLEINSHPLRLDVDWRFLKYAKEKGVMICINPDAHSVKDLDYVVNGVNIARKGWLTKNDVLNTRTAKEIERTLKQ